MAYYGQTVSTKWLLLTKAIDIDHLSNSITVDCRPSPFPPNSDGAS